MKGWAMQPLSEAPNSRQERTERYRREAALVPTIAEATLDPQTRRELRDVARNYEILAMSIELLPPSPASAHLIDTTAFPRASDSRQRSRSSRSSTRVVGGSRSPCRSELAGI